jgi:hypothetical protein
MKHKALMVMTVVVLAAMGSVRAARADVAPPQPPPGASIQSGNPSTYVQMVSESVLMEITDYNGPSLWDVNMGLASVPFVASASQSRVMVGFDMWLAIGMIMIGGAFVIGMALLVAWAFWDRRPARW